MRNISDVLDNMLRFMNAAAHGPGAAAEQDMFSDNLNWRWAQCADDLKYFKLL